MRNMANQVPVHVAKSIAETFCKSQVDPALYKEAKELIQKLFNRRDGSNWAIQQMERFLKTAGYRLRQG